MGRNVLLAHALKVNPGEENLRKVGSGELREGQSPVEGLLRKGERVVRECSLLLFFGVVSVTMVGKAAKPNQRPGASDIESAERVGVRFSGRLFERDSSASPCLVMFFTPKKFEVSPLAVQKKEKNDCKWEEIKSCTPQHEARCCACHRWRGGS